MKRSESVLCEKLLMKVKGFFDSLLQLELSFLSHDPQRSDICIKRFCVIVQNYLYFVRYVMLDVLKISHEMLHYIRQIIGYTIELIKCPIPYHLS